MAKCPICNRELGEVLIEDHHLIPKTFKGKEVITIHAICHRTIHSIFSERELLHEFNTVENILSNDKIQKFVKWIKNKPLDFYIKTKDSVERKNKRRK